MGGSSKETIEKLFRHKILHMLKEEGAIDDSVVENLLVFDPLEFIAELVAHIPDAYEKTAIEYGWYSNRTRGFRKEHGLLRPDPPAKDPAADSDKASLDTRRAWARLIAKVYEVNPLLCPKCGSEMKIVAVIAEEDAIYKILKHLGLLAAPEESRAPPAAATSPASTPPQAALHDLFSSTALNDPFSDLPAWDLPDPPGPDHASQPDSDPGDHLHDRDDGPNPEAEDIAQAVRVHTRNGRRSPCFRAAQSARRNACSRWICGGPAA